MKHDHYSPMSYERRMTAAMFVIGIVGTIVMALTGQWWVVPMMIASTAYVGWVGVKIYRRDHGADDLGPDDN